MDLPPSPPRGSTQAPTRAPWADAPPSASTRPLPQPPTRAPWADGASVPTRRPPPPTAAGPAPHIAPTPVGDDDDGPPAWPAVVPLDEGAAPARKFIFNADDLATFRASSTFKHYIAFIRFVNDAVRGVPMSAAASLSPGAAALVAALDALNALIDAVPPAAAALRYGNPAFRTWHARAAEAAEGLIATVLPAARAASDARVLAPYLVDALGNASRVDYGTGHETTFVALLFCLARAGAVVASDAAGLATRVFAAYGRLTRRLQTTYWLEPAGSHGVWGLDDYVFLPFYWGSAQLDSPAAAGAGAPRPGVVVRDEAVLNEWGDEYLYIDAVRFVKKVKKGPLGETSPMLCDIAAVPTWGKINTGMLKMYKVEVLGKVPIMQHSLFCYLMPFGR